MADDYLKQAMELVKKECPGWAHAAIADAIHKAIWTTAYINDLPDSAFLHIEGGGEKDSEGKTKPRNLRHFPVKDDEGSVDLPHLRNALARIPQSNLNAEAKDKARRKAEAMLEASKT